MKNKTILIAAPGSGIGQIITKKLLEDNYSIIGIGRENSRKFCQHLEEQNQPIEFFDCNYTEEESVINTFSKAKSLFPTLDGMIHLVGGSLFSKKIEEIALNDLQKVISVNLVSAFLIGREAYKWMKETGGNMIFFGSTTGYEPSKKKLPYGIAKAALHSMIGSFALEGSEYNIITNAIAPGYVMTERHVEEIELKATTTSEDVETLIKAIKEKNPLKQVLYPSDIYPLVKLLLETKHIQGKILTIDLGQILCL